MIKRTVPVIIVSAAQDSQSIEQAAELRVSAVLIKSRFGWPELRHLMEQTLAGGPDSGPAARLRHDTAEFE